MAGPEKERGSVYQKTENQHKSCFDFLSAGVKTPAMASTAPQSESEEGRSKTGAALASSTARSAMSTPADRLIQLELEHRLAVRNRPPLRSIGSQRWNHLLFAHWRVDAQLVQASLPPGLYVDTHEGAAYIGVVPFFMQRVRPAGCPPLPWISWFQELNVRTYVHDGRGRPGVWFYSLDCNQPVAVLLARQLFHLPYFHARMAARLHEGAHHYECRRHGERDADSGFSWTPGPTAAPAEPGTLAFFLVERYLLFARSRAGRLFSGQVHHAPYQVHTPVVSRWSAAPAIQAGFAVPGEPVSLLGANAVDVSIFPLTPVP